MPEITEIVCPRHDVTAPFVRLVGERLGARGTTVTVHDHGEGAG
ncbi:hypothetical protein ABZX39_26600 [Streptomyces collinus]